MKIRLSYTILRLWKQSRTDDLIKNYLHLETEKTPDMQRGLDFENKVYRLVEKNKKLPDWLGGTALKNFKVQEKIVVAYNELADLSGVFDLVDEPIIYEFKNSINMTSGDFLSDYQAGFYLLLANLSGLKIKKVEVIRFDPISMNYDRAILYNNKRTIEETKNLIDSLLPEIHNFINSVLFKYDNKRNSKNIAL